MPLILDRFLLWGDQPHPSHSVEPREEAHQDLFKMPSLTLTFDRTRGLHIHLDAPWFCNPPPPSPSGSLWGLWEYEVFELFILGDEGRYLEIEFGPYGHFLVLELSGPREISRKDLTLNELNIERVSDLSSARMMWSVEANVPLDLLPEAIDVEGVPHWGLNAFWCFDKENERKYWNAFPLPGDQPNFHQPDHFPLCSLNSLMQASRKDH